ncbi:Rv1535 domain-containing protein [Mycobacterium shinjukuense]|uniref:Rv1535 domain-containing protein n=1 Tax=Mycobacterium shinjukuense TaxID=398694 RepID=UPI002279E4F7|nr:Rv1535 domain-containing protein [Mycobacterium shinjukuense]
MTRTDAQADPLVSSIAWLLTVPLRELYALLWRVGVVEVHGTEPAAHRRPAGKPPSSAARRRTCPDPSAHASQWPPRWSRQSRTLDPGPSPAVRAGCSRAAG